MKEESVNVDYVIIFLALAEGGIQLDNKRIPNLFKPGTNVYLWIIGLLVFLLYFYTVPIAVIGSFLFVGLIVYKFFVDNRNEERWQQMVENLQLDMDAASQNIMINLPFPLIVLRDDETILWYNSGFREIWGSRANVLNQEITSVFADFEMNPLKGHKEPWLEYVLQEKHYRIYTNTVTNAKGERIYLLYWVDDNDWWKLKKQRELERPVLAFVQVDNFDEILNSSNESYRPLIAAIIDQKINSWCKEYEVLANKYEEDQYLLVFEQSQLIRMEDKKFHILDIMRETQSGNRIPITLSIGVGYSDQEISYVQRKELAKSALDIALARGGDQAVIRRNEAVQYYGGKQQALEKRTKTKARLKAYGIRELMEHGDKVFIMGHAAPDVDAMGAALGVYRCANALGKKAYIVLDHSNPSIEVLYQEMRKEGYMDVLISGDAAKKLLTHQSLLIIVDVHKRDLVQDVELLDQAEKVVVIDHHIRSAQFIEKAILTYLEPYASSTCELVTEVLEYVAENVELTVLESTALLAGIQMDTKGFAVKTGVRTFEAASFLRKKGADTILAKTFLKDDLEVLKAKSEALKEVQFLREGIALAFVENRTEKVQLIAAQTADDMLNIQGVEASFVIAQNKEGAIISGRSYGKVNVQRILEELGGGGHMTIAGAQLPGKDLQQAKQILEAQIDTFRKEEGRS